MLAQNSEDGTDSLLVIKDLVSCNIARDAIIDSGLGLIVPPVECRVFGFDGQDFSASNAALEFSISQPYSYHLLRGKSSISRSDCESAKQALTGVLLENDEKMGHTPLRADCRDGSESGQSVLILTIGSDQ